MSLAKKRHILKFVGKTFDICRRNKWKIGNGLILLNSTDSKWSRDNIWPAWHWLAGFNPSSGGKTKALIRVQCSQCDGDGAMWRWGGSDVEMGRGRCGDGEGAMEVGTCLAFQAMSASHAFRQTTAFYSHRYIRRFSSNSDVFPISAEQRVIFLFSPPFPAFLSFFSSILFINYFL